MKTQIHVFLLCSVVNALLVLASCGAPSTTVPSESGATLTPTFMPSSSSTPTSDRNPNTLPTTPTFEPTLPATEEQRMKELLQAGDCKLPCYLGIRPGKTTLQDARAILEALGASYLGEYKRRIDDGIEYPYVL